MAYAHRCVLRHRIDVIEQAADNIEAAYGDFAKLVTDGPDVRLGDALRVPEYMEDQEYALWEVVWMLQACARQLRTELMAEEKAA